MRGIKNARKEESEVEGKRWSKNGECGSTRVSRFVDEIIIHRSFDDIKRYVNEHPTRKIFLYKKTCARCKAIVIETASVMQLVIFYTNTEPFNIRPIFASIEFLRAKETRDRGISVNASHWRVLAGIKRILETTSTFHRRINIPSWQKAPFNILPSVTARHDSVREIPCCPQNRILPNITIELVRDA